MHLSYEFIRNPCDFRVFDYILCNSSADCMHPNKDFEGMNPYMHDYIYIYIYIYIFKGKGGISVNPGIPTAVKPPLTEIPLTVKPPLNRNS